MARVTTRAPYNARCLYSAKQLVSKVETREKLSLACLLNVYNVGSERMCSGKPFWATKPAIQNVRLPNCSLALGTNKLSKEAERRTKRLGTVDGVGLLTRSFNTTT